MKDIAHHLKHIQRKVIRETRQEQSKAPLLSQEAPVQKTSVKENFASARSR
ncbi:MAG: hypothetical protein H0V82_09335 [Candidatus Protochlamydia sp.]|nr:hypothetical protein [Candidatus Protochlamydia sp.]